MTEQQAIQQFYQDFDMIGFTMAQELVKELEGQGHKATGDLIRSIIATTQQTLDGIESSISNLAYGKSLNDGIPASKVPRYGAAYGDLLFSLVKWIRVKKLAFGADKAYRFAANIIRKAQQTGFPTPGSYKFSRNGRRKGWIDYVADNYQIQFGDQVADASLDLVANYLNAKLDAIVKQFSQELQ
jgi:hypothetical protein